MLSYLIRLDKAGSPVDFINVMDKIPGNVTIIDGQRQTNAKSLLGVMNTRRNVPVNLTFECAEEELQEAMPLIEKCKIV